MVSMGSPLVVLPPTGSKFNSPMSYPHREPADRSARHLIVWSLAAGLLLLVAMAGPFLAGRVCTADDLGAFHLPLRAYYSEQLAQGESFDWMPQLFCGFYVTGEGQAARTIPCTCCSTGCSRCKSLLPPNCCSPIR